VRNRWLILALLLSSAPAWGAITVVGGCQASSTSCTPTAPKIGDLFIAFAAHTGATTIPTLPAGWTSVTTGTVTGDIGYRIACKVANSAAETATGFTNANYLVVTERRGTNVFGSRTCGAIGTPVKNSSTGTTTFAYGALTLTNDGGTNTSWVGGDIVIDGTSTSSLNAPTGMTQQEVTSSGTAPGAAAQDTNATVASWSTTNVTGGSSVPYADATFEINAAPAVTACSGTCPGLVDDKNYGSNDADDVASATYKFDLLNAALGGNLIVCGVTFDGTVSGGVPTPSFTMTDNTGSNTWTKAVFASDGTRATGLVYAANAASGTLHLTVTLGAAAKDFSAQCAQFYNVAQSSPVDGTPTVATGVAGPTLSGTAITTTQTGDLIFVYVPDTQSSGYCCTTVPTSYVPGPGFNLLTVEPALGNSAEMMSWGSSGSITPEMWEGNASDTFAVASIAFKSASAGTAPNGIWIYCNGVNKMTGSVASVEVQVPCPVSANTLVVGTNSTAADFTLSAVTDSPDGNAYTEVTTSGYPQIYYSDSAAFTNSNSRYMLLANNHASTAAVEWYVIGGADPSAYDGSAINSGTQTVAGGSTCTNSSSVNSTVSLTPTTNRHGVIIMMEQNGTGPECATSTTNGVFDAWWYAGETDGNTNGYTASGFGHLKYTSNSAQTYTSNWANATASAWTNEALAFKAPANAAPRRRAWVIP
jgi:hypothetical protein